MKQVVVGFNFVRKDETVARARRISDRTKAGGESLADTRTCKNGINPTLPLATARKTYYLVLRYVNADSGEETVVRSVVARPT